MLGRLFKYEMKATAKILIPIYIAFIAISIISRVSFELQVDENSPLYFITVLSLFVFALSAIAVFVITAIVIVWRFYRNTSSDEGYLLFTLPVKTDCIILSEFLCGFIWCTAMSAVFIIGIMLMLINRNIDGAIMDFGYFGNMLSLLSADGVKAIFAVLINSIISALSEMMTIYCAISIASLFKKHRLILSVAFYLTLLVLINFFDVIIIQAISNSFVQESYDIDIYNAVSLADVWNNSIAPEMLSAQTIIDTVYFVLIAVIEYFVVRLILKKHLNID